MKQCSNCNNTIQVTDKFCPYCGYSQKPPRKFNLLFLAVGLLVLFFLFILLGKVQLPPPVATQEILTLQQNDSLNNSSQENFEGNELEKIAKFGSMVSSKDGMTLVYVPAGEFIMGSNDGYSDEQPIHTVYLDAFWISQTEITNGMYEKCVSTGKCSSQNKSYHNPSTGSYNFGESNYKDYPAVYVNWEQANTYCAWANGRLPTEAEWEKAARDEESFTYPWGNQSANHSLANYDNYLGDTVEVASYIQGASPYGVLDMAGNVWEWVADYYDENYYSYSSMQNPIGPTSGSVHVLRGGSFFAEEGYIRTTMRSSPGSAETESYGSGNWGFRCVFDY